jgi:hypothetical protein
MQFGRHSGTPGVLRHWGIWRTALPQLGMAAQIEIGAAIPVACAHHIRWHADCLFTDTFPKGRIYKCDLVSLY